MYVQQPAADGDSDNETTPSQRTLRSRQQRSPSETVEEQPSVNGTSHTTHPEQMDVEDSSPVAVTDER